MLPNTNCFPPHNAGERSKGGPRSKGRSAMKAVPGQRRFLQKHEAACSPPLSWWVNLASMEVIAVLLGRHVKSPKPGLRTIAVSQHHASKLSGDNLDNVRVCRV